jgi:hypothetical protein
MLYFAPTNKSKLLYRISNLSNMNTSLNPAIHSSFNVKVDINVNINTNTTLTSCT